ncbi:MAG: ATP-grasp domain-containing protein [Acidobacteriia bacterium]|nr:ATP-grasp domain-containing protein [Terriglobia bacterium]
MRKLLVANRGEIARRIFRTCDQLGIATVAVYSHADRDAPHVREAREAIYIGPAESRDSYLRIEKILEAVRRTGADAIHPGYGFLAETADFAEACEARGLIFVGPRADAIRAMASKIEARKIAKRAGVPVVPSEGFPLLVKAAAGGGGKGMRRVDRAEDLESARAEAAREAEAAFGDGTLLIERYLERARHIEVQIFGDLHGNVVHLFERECSVQRRHQKIIEESPAPNLSPDVRGALCEAALRIAREIGYSSAGTVEFLVTPAGEFFFLEVNTRIQVEHPVTEMVLGFDLVRMQIEVAEGRALPALELEPRGHAIEARLYAEDPANGFLPSTGKILAWRAPQGVRVESGIERETEVGIHYDPLLAKIIAHANSRAKAIRKLRWALERTLVHGVTMNREFLTRVLDHPDFAAGSVHTDFAITYERDRSAEAVAKTALDAYRDARRQATRAVLPHVPSGYRNNPFQPAPPRAQVISCDEGHIRVEIDGAQYSFDVSEDASRHWIGDFSFARESRYPSEEGAASEESASSPMPGKVLRILVEPNGEVQPGDPLVILEAMKMEQTVRAHAAGIVDAVLVKPGQVVAPGETLVHVRSKGESK